MSNNNVSYCCFSRQCEIHNLTSISDQNYDEAVTVYSKCIEKNPTNAVYYANRSIAYLRTEYFGYALADASKAIELNKSYLKGYYRRAAAHMNLGKFKLALKDFEYVCIIILSFYFLFHSNTMNKACCGGYTSVLHATFTDCLIMIESTV